AADAIREVLIHCSTMAHRHCAWPYAPAGVTAAQMNLYFTAAMMLLDRNAMQDQFHEDRLRDPAALAMIERISIEADPKDDGGGDDGREGGPGARGGDAGAGGQPGNPAVATAAPPQVRDARGSAVAAGSHCADQRNDRLARRQQRPRADRSRHPGPHAMTDRR